MSGAISEEALGAVIDRLHEPAFVALPSGELRRANPAAGGLLGAPQAALRGRLLASFVAAAPEALREFLRAASRTGSPVRDRVTLRRADGTQMECRWEGGIIRPGEGPAPALLLIRVVNREAALGRFVALNLKHEELLREVQRRRAMETALRESEARFRTMADEMPQLAWMAGPDGAIFWYNRRWYEYTGTTPEEMVGWGWQSVHDPERLPAVLERWKASIDSGSPFEMVFPLRGGDGRLRPFLTRVAPYRDAAGAIVHWFGTNTDVSAQHEAEEALRAADRRKDEFLATLAHELRNPLAPIRNSVALMGMAGPLPEAADHARKIVDRQVGHLTRLVDDLLEVSRITQGKVQLRIERISLLQPVRDAMEAIAPVADAAGHRLHLTLPEEPLYVNADATRLTQIVQNLLNNAVKFTPRGGHIWVCAERAGRQALITVRDTGVGIAAAHLERVFEMFAQPRPALERSEGGLGIGLALVRGLSDLHGGSVSASSPGPGKGSQFSVHLPLAEGTPEEQPQPAPLQGAGAAGARKRILVVDDNVDAASSLAALLELSGHEVRQAHDGIEGIHAAGVFRPEVVFLDIGMPRMNGYDAAKEMRKQAQGGPLRIVALTGWGQEHDRRRADEAGFDLHLTKPVDLDVLQSLLDERVK